MGRDRKDVDARTTIPCHHNCNSTGIKKPSGDQANRREEAIGRTENRVDTFGRTDRPSSSRAARASENAEGYSRLEMKEDVRPSDRPTSSADRQDSYEFRKIVNPRIVSFDRRSIGSRA